MNLIKGALIHTYKWVDSLILVNTSDYKYYNTLMFCLSCKDYSRRYQVYIKPYEDENYKRLSSNSDRFLCPHCYSNNYKDARESYQWMDHIPKAPKLNLVQTRDLLRTIKRLKSIEYSNESMKKFIEYNQGSHKQ